MSFWKVYCGGGSGGGGLLLLVPVPSDQCLCLPLDYGCVAAESTVPPAAAAFVCALTHAVAVPLSSATEAAGCGIWPQLGGSGCAPVRVV